MRPETNLIGSAKAGPRNRGPLIAIAIVVLALAALVASLGSTGSAVAGAAGKRPNVVVIMTDDQTLAALEFMPKTRAAFDDEGTEFTNAFVSYSLCCPSRATFLTGQYGHNNGVMDNKLPLGGYTKLKARNTLAVWLRRAGYHTTLIGKYLNGYAFGDAGVQPGWSKWYVSKRDFKYYGVDVLDNGKLITIGSPDENPYDPADPDSQIDDAYTREAIEVIGKRALDDRPFFLWLSYTAPHTGGPDPEPPAPDRCVVAPKPPERYLGDFASEPLPMPPSFNEADISDKPPGIRDRPLLTDDQIEAIRNRYQCELEALKGIDDGVADVISELDSTGELANTVIVFTSDNGYMHGEHRIALGKAQAYDEASRVPLLMRGPGIPAGQQVGELANNVDMAPTIAALTGAVPRLRRDGRSLLPLAARPNLRRGRTVLIENKRGRGVRTHHYLFFESQGGGNAGFQELYDMDVDPYQTQNLVSTPSYRRTRFALSELLDELRQCAGASCRKAPAAVLWVRDAKRRLGPGHCAHGGVTIGVGGDDAGRMSSAQLTLASVPVSLKSLRPLRARIPASQLTSEPQRLFARVELLDGRELTLQRKLRAC